MLYPSISHILLCGMLEEALWKVHCAECKGTIHMTGMKIILREGEEVKGVQEVNEVDDI